MVAVLTAAALSPSWRCYPSRQKMARAIWNPNAGSVSYTQVSKAEEKMQPQRWWAVACEKKPEREKDRADRSGQTDQVLHLATWGCHLNTSLTQSQIWFLKGNLSTSYDCNTQQTATHCRSYKRWCKWPHSKQAAECILPNTEGFSQHNCPMCNKKEELTP